MWLAVLFTRAGAETVPGAGWLVYTKTQTCLLIKIAPVTDSKCLQYKSRRWCTIVQLEFDGLTGRVGFDRGRRQRFTLNVLQMMPDTGLEAVWVQGRSHSTLGGIEAERRRHENRGAKDAERGRDWGGGVLLPQPTRGSGERLELPQRGPGRSPSRQRIFGIFEVHRTLLVERTVPTKPVFP